MNRRTMNNWKDKLFVAGAVMVLAGALLQMTRWPVAPYLYLLGAVPFAFLQLSGGCEGADVVERRLRRQQMLGAVLLVVAGLMMLFLRHNEWVACLSIAAVLELYTAFRLPSPPRHP